MPPDFIQPVVQVGKVAKLLNPVTIRVKRGEIPGTLESSREIDVHLRCPIFNGCLF